MRALVKCVAEVCLHVCLVSRFRCLFVILIHCFVVCYYYFGNGVLEVSCLLKCC